MCRDRFSKKRPYILPNKGKKLIDLIKYWLYKFEDLKFMIRNMRLRGYLYDNIVENSNKNG